MPKQFKISLSQLRKILIYVTNFSQKKEKKSLTIVLNFWYFDILHLMIQILLTLFEAQVTVGLNDIFNFDPNTVSFCVTKIRTVSSLSPMMSSYLLVPFLFLECLARYFWWSHYSRKVSAFTSTNAQEADQNGEK